MYGLLVVALIGIAGKKKVNNLPVLFAAKVEKGTLNFGVLLIQYETTPELYTFPFSQI